MTRIDAWTDYTEATITGDDRARRMGQQLTTATPPIKLARRARHRKPNRRRITQKILTGAAIAALLAGTGATGAALQAITPQQVIAAQLESSAT